LKKKSIEHLEGATQSDRERLAIVFEEPEFKLDLESTKKRLESNKTSSNIVEILKEKLENSEY
jgi:hypothetical protein